MIVPYPIFTNNNIKTKRKNFIIYICIFSIFVSFIIWYIRFSEPIKIYKAPKFIDPVQYRL